MASLVTPLMVKVLSTHIFMCLSTKLASLHHVDERWLELKSIISNLDRQSSTDVGYSWSREFTESLVSPGFKFRC